MTRSFSTFTAQASMPKSTTYNELGMWNDILSQSNHSLQYSNSLYSLDQTFANNCGQQKNGITYSHSSFNVSKNSKVIGRPIRGSSSTNLIHHPTSQTQPSLYSNMELKLSIMLLQSQLEQAKQQNEQKPELFDVNALLIPADSEINRQFQLEQLQLHNKHIKEQQDEASRIYLKHKIQFEQMSNQQTQSVQPQTEQDQFQTFLE
jgi:hypothetical protein